MTRSLTSLIGSLSIGLGLVGCVTSPEDGSQVEVPTADGKADGAPVQCGEDTCEASLCGYDCSAVGSQCVLSCAAEDTRIDTLVTATLVGTDTVSFDSTTNEYTPLQSLENFVNYGCDLSDWTDGSADSLTIGYAEIFDNPVYQVGRTGVQFSLTILDFLGPGSYKAQGQYSRSSESSSYADFASGCTVTVNAEVDGGISGEFTCTLAGLNIAGNAEVQGTFGCGHTAIAGRVLSAINPVEPVEPTPEPTN